MLLQEAAEFCLGHGLAVEVALAVIAAVTAQHFFLLVFLDRGAGEISTVFGLNQSFADILSGIIIFFIIGCEFFITYRLSFRKSAKKEAAEHV